MSGELEILANIQTTPIAKYAFLIVRFQLLLNGLTMPIKRSIAVSQRDNTEASNAMQTIAFPTNGLQMMSLSTVELNQDSLRLSRSIRDKMTELSNPPRPSLSAGSSLWCALTAFFARWWSQRRFLKRRRTRWTSTVLWKRWLPRRHRDTEKNWTDFGSSWKDFYSLDATKLSLPPRYGLNEWLLLPFKSFTALP